MSLLHESDAGGDLGVDAPLHTFRAATIEAALAEARAELGDDVRIVEANRIRRGGVGGFFATELGVELVVSPGDGSSGSSEDRVDGEARSVEPEYLTTGPLDRAAPLPRASAPPARSDTADRPQFYDREFEEDVSTDASDASEVSSPGIARLLEAAGRAEQGEQAQAPRSFADHLARHVAAQEPSGLVATPSRRPITGSVAERDPSLPAVEAPAVEAPHAEVPDAETPDAEAPDAEVPVAEVPASVAEVPVPTPEPVVGAPGEAAARSSRDAAPRRSSKPRDPMRRPIDLAAGAVGRIVEQLSDVAPADGSRMNDLSRLVVKVTLPDGAVIEIAAELDGNRDV